MKKPFIYIVDSFFDVFDSEGEKALGELGLRDHYDYVDKGAGGADGILHHKESGKPLIENRRLLVFMSSFHGQTAPAVELSKKIKERNPETLIIFRSTVPASQDPVFDKCIDKDLKTMIEITKEFLEKED